jgi:PAS domain S-box-containing protein
MGFLLRIGKTPLLIAVACLILVIAVSDRAVGNSLSLGVLYILPMMVAGIALPRAATLALGIFCAFLRARFDVPSTQTEMIFRFVFASLSYGASGLFVTALVRNRSLVSEHLSRLQQEQKLRHEAEEQLRLLVASSPAAILTLDGKGLVLAANDAARNLLALPQGTSLIGETIAGYVPVLADALRLENAPEGFRTEAQCQSYRDDGEIFMAHVWFSSYQVEGETRLAAIIVDASEEMRDREEQNLQDFQISNRIAAAALSHELRNMCAAISLMTNHLKERPGLGQDKDFQGLTHLVEAMAKITGQGLKTGTGDSLAIDEVPLRRVLDYLRIVMDSEWRSIDATIHWNLPKLLPVVQADEHGLLQAFFNLMQNSQRAVQQVDHREMEICAAVEGPRVFIRFHDSGPGIAAPEHLFQPFQEGAEKTGLGLYVSRAMIRSYGGDLRYEPTSTGCRFVVELQGVTT